MPKLLDVVKESGYSHEEIIKMIDEAKNQKMDTEIEESIEEEVEKEPIELQITDMKTEEEEIESPEEEVEETVQLTQEELDNKIEEALNKVLKSKRKVPSKGKIFDKPQSNIAVIKRNWFEEIV